MSNEIEVQYTKFSNIDEEGNVTEETLGYRIYDSYGEAYNNTYESLKDLKEEVNEDNLLDFIREHHPDYSDSLEHTDVYLNGKLCSEGKPLL